MPGKADLRDLVVEAIAGSVAAADEAKAEAEVRHGAEVVERVIVNRRDPLGGPSTPGSTRSPSSPPSGAGRSS